MSRFGLRVKRSMAMVLVCFLLVGLIPAQVFANEATGFSDIEGHWAENSINKVVENGLFKGSTDQAFDPQGTMTRAMFVTVLHRLADKLDAPKVKEQLHSFTDVPENAWYAEGINWAVSAGLTDGYGNGTFGPNDLLDREQITVLMIRFLNVYMGYDLSSYESSALFADDAQISSWAKEAVYQAVALGLVEGEKGNAFNPKGTASRAVVAVITERFLEKSAELVAGQPSETPAPSETPVPSETPEPTATPEPTDNSNSGGSSSGGSNSGGGNSGGGSTTVKVTEVTIQRDTTEVTGTAIRSGDQLSVKVKPAAAQATATVKWFVSGVFVSEAATYEVRALDVGAVITAEVTGTGKYTGTVTSEATGKVLANVDLSNRDVDNTPVAIADGVTFKDEQGNDVTLADTDSISFSVTASEVEISEGEKENVTKNLKEQLEGTELDVEELAIKYVAIEAALLVESEEGNAAVIHPVGETTLTLSKTSLGFGADEDISQHVFLIGHTNKNGVQESVQGEVVVINDEQYVRVTLNGLSTVYIGNVPPLTISFDTDGGSEVPAKKVKLGEITPEVEAPTKEGSFFIGWNVDLNNSPIYMDMTIKALWLEGAYIPDNRISIVDWYQMSVFNYTVDDKGVVKIAFDESNEIEANLEYYVDIEAPDNAAQYVLSDSAEAAAVASSEHAEAVVDGSIKLPTVVITDEDAKVITGNYHSYIKWFDDEGAAIVLEAVTVSVETNERSATREQTFNVNRGIGKVDVLLTANSDENEDYYSYLNGHLDGDAIANNYKLNLNASFDGRKYFEDELVNIDFASFSGLKLIFTPFEGESYQDAATKASAYYWNNSKRQDIILETKLNDEGLLEVTTPSVYNFKEMAGTANSFYLYVTVEAGGRSQQLNINMHDIGETTEETETKHISTNEWSEVISGFAENENISIYYSGEAVELNTALELKEHQSLSIGNSSFTIGSGGELKLTGTQYGGSYMYVNGDIIVSDGGIITTNSQLQTQGSYYHTSVQSNNKLTVASGGEITIPENGFMSLNGTDGIIVEQNGALNVLGVLYVNNNTEINGTMSIISSNESYDYLKGRATIYGDVTINGLLEVSKNGSLSVSGMNSINEDGELRVSKGSISLNGKTYNNGKITVTEGSLTLSNVGFAVNNDGVINIAKNAVVNLPGTILVNNGEILGSGSIALIENVNASANYDNGIEYVNVEGIQSPSHYSRYQFVNDPKETVTGIIYESKISGTGTLDSTITINENKIPDIEE